MDFFETNELANKYCFLSIKDRGETEIQMYAYVLSMSLEHEFPYVPSYDSFVKEVELSLIDRTHTINEFDKRQLDYGLCLQMLSESFSFTKNSYLFYKDELIPFALNSCEITSNSDEHIEYSIAFSPYFSTL